jgi:pyridoxal phosphate enzyme (YggS family)
MIKTRYDRLRSEVAHAAEMSGRDPNDVQIVAVTKGVAWKDVLPLYQLGHRDFGENRVAEALAKQAEAPPDCLWHFIGTLQMNKVRKVVGKFTLIHSVDSVALAQKLSEVSVEMGVVTSILLQVNISGETTKHGLSAEQWKTAFDEVLALPGLKIKGLMTMAPAEGDEQVVRNCFKGLRLLRDELREKCPMDQLSMGMSGDFRLAIEEGATMIRVGSALFNQ